MRNLPATSFIENKRYGLQAREQGFPKLCPTLSESRYRAISLACNEASNLGGRIYATVTAILLMLMLMGPKDNDNGMCSCYRYISNLLLVVAVLAAFCKVILMNSDLALLFIVKSNQFQPGTTCTMCFHMCVFGSGADKGIET